MYLSSEKKSLYRFLTIYLISTFLLFGIAISIFYYFSKGEIIASQNRALEFKASKIKDKLRVLHQSDNQRLPYPVIKGIDSAIYDIDGNYIFGTKKDISKQNGYLYQEFDIKPYYLGASKLVVTSKIDFSPIDKLKIRLITFMIFVFLLLTILGLYLGKLFIAPMKESINKINNFIQDATHELNTPISTILTNLELIEDLTPQKELKKPLKRVEIASKSLSKIYSDLSYLQLNHNYHKNIKRVRADEILKERLEYFKLFIEAKNINLKTNIKPTTLNIDSEDLIRLIDNLISNSIKYNKSNGSLEVTINSTKLIVKDSGIGIDKEDLSKILERYKRANKSEGGFGIGLNIVDKIVKSYGYKIEIDSILDKGTTITILWSKQWNI